MICLDVFSGNNVIADTKLERKKPSCGAVVEASFVLCIILHCATKMKQSKPQRPGLSDSEGFVTPRAPGGTQYHSITESHIDRVARVTEFGKC